MLDLINPTTLPEQKYKTTQHQKGTQQTEGPLEIFERPYEKGFEEGKKLQTIDKEGGGQSSKTSGEGGAMKDTRREHISPNRKLNRRVPARGGNISGPALQY